MNTVIDAHSKMTETGDDFVIVKGNVNKLRLRPQIVNEHQESSREALATVDSSTVVGQVFKASEDNINSLSLTLESAATFASMDAITTGAGEKKAGTMEYSADAALQAEYIKSGSVEATRSAFTDDVAVTQDGSYACKFTGATAADEWRVALTSTDLSGVTFRLKFSQTHTFTLLKVYFFVGDGTNTKSFPLSVLTSNVWQTFSIPEDIMTVESTDDTATTPNMAAITRMGFRIDDSHPASFGYADSIAYQAKGGSVDLELWDFGTSLPASDKSVDYTTKDQYTELGDRGIGGGVASSIRVPLVGGKQLYHVHGFIAGVASEIPGNTLLTVGNYYSVVIKYVDTDVTVFGADTTFSTSYYNNGYAWDADTGDADEIEIISGAAGAGAYSDLMFKVFSVQEVWITGTELKLDAAAGSNAQFQIFVEDSGMKVTDIIAGHESKFGTEHVKDLSLRPILMESGAKMECYYNDDPTDSVLEVAFKMTYFYAPNGANN